MYAIIATGGKQYKISENDTVRVEKLLGNAGDKINFDKILMVGGDNGPKVGRPYLNGANVEAEILAQDRAKKVLVFKKKRRKGFKKMIGHRQCYTEVRVTKISL
ncbi:MAG: 50S ribosomal protein L21 [Deltaproteobacteria bacterium RIFCSPLOWO2_02_FULL_47_10]|nr:MAG: 50S ribosomal protein L21 [Deltaproteobacteria bacterium RIFCSPLOWO2_02_FULL_47_10]